MLKKRLIGAVIIKNGWAVQSFGYNRYLPLGKPEHIVENLDRWGVDEILVQSIDRSVRKKGPDFELLGQLSQLGLNTPLIFGGGINSVEDGVKVIQRGADRIVIDTILHDDQSTAKDLSEQLGAQAIIGSVPVSVGSRGLDWYDYRIKSSVFLGEALSKTICEGLISEILLTDWQNEGKHFGFRDEIIDRFPNANVSLIAFGGISNVTHVENLLMRPNVTAVAIGNFLSYREHAVQHFKEKISSSLIRPPIYAIENGS